MRRRISIDPVSLAAVFLSLVILLFSALGSRTTASNAVVDETLSASPAEQNQAVERSESQTPLDPQLKPVLEKLAAAGIAHATSVEDVRRAYLFYPKLSGTPEHVFRVEDRQLPGPVGNISARIYIPNSAADLPLFVFFHGGGFVAGSLDTHDTPLRAVTNRCGCIIVSVAYRLAPENKYPASIEDAYAATKWVAEHGTEIGGDPHRVAVGGDGSGGNLAAAVTLMSRDRGTPHLTFQLLIYPMLDATIMRPSWWTESGNAIVSRESKNEILGLYLPITGNLRDPLVSPIFADTLKNLPPALIITDQDDPMRDEGEEYAGRLTQDGVQAKLSAYPGMIHGFFLMAGDLDAGKKCIAEVGAALKNAFKTT